MRSGMPHPGAFPAHENIPGHSKHFRGQQQQQHNLVPIMHIGVGLPDETQTGRIHEHIDEYNYPPSLWVRIITRTSITVVYSLNKP